MSVKKKFAAKRDKVLEVRPRGGHDKPPSPAKPDVEPRPGYRNHFPKGKSSGGPGKVSRSHEMAIAQRELIVSELYLKGMSQMMIVVELAKRNIVASQPTVSNDIKHITERWHAQAVTDLEKRKVQEIEGLNKLELFAWRELERSRFRVLKKKNGEEDAAHEERTERVRKEASVQWHEQIRKVRRDRVELLGLIKNVTVNNNSVNVLDKDFWAAVSDPPTGEDPIEAKIESVRVLGPAKEQK